MFTSLCNGLHRRVMAGPGISLLSLYICWSRIASIPTLFVVVLHLFGVIVRLSVSREQIKRAFKQKPKGPSSDFVGPRSVGHQYCKKVLGSVGPQPHVFFEFNINKIIMLQRV